MLLILAPEDLGLLTLIRREFAVIKLSKVALIVCLSMESGAPQEVGVRNGGRISKLCLSSLEPSVSSQFNFFMVAPKN
jgi:hypothetical protein